VEKLQFTALSLNQALILGKKKPDVKMKFISPSSELKYARGMGDAHRLQMQLRCSQRMRP